MGRGLLTLKGLQAVEDCRVSAVEEDLFPGHTPMSSTGQAVGASQILSILPPRGDVTISIGLSAAAQGGKLSRTTISHCSSKENLLFCKHNKLVCHM